VLAVSAERIDTGATCMPWVRIGGLHFSEEKVGFSPY
jgi:hypothetical protein